jgi:Family of unknown function (DUF5985)
MDSVVYGLCAFTSIACAVLLLSAHRRNPTRLLLLSGLCFCGLGVNNLLLFADFMTGSQIDLSLYRNATAAGSVLLLLVGLILGQGERD